MRILIVVNRQNTATLDTFFQIAAYLDSQGIAHDEIDLRSLPDAAAVYDPDPVLLERTLGCDYGLIITLGGDGTILHTARLAYLLDAPIMGINLGHLGFLANTADESVIALVADALAGEVLREQRMNLRIEVECVGDEEEPPDSPRVFFALNEIAIARGALGHIVDFSFAISGDRIASMRGDGLVVATATGSTAYSLSAGGPLVGPSHRGMIVVPLAPHTLNSRAIVVEHHDVVEVAFQPDGSSASEVSLFADGDALSFSRPISRVRVTVGEHPTTLLTQRRESFYKLIAHTFFD